jgi:DNA-binding GntR family transcriptional regulator
MRKVKGRVRARNGGIQNNSSGKGAAAPKLDGPLKERIYARIKDDILTCVFAPGESCSESKLAGRYGVSKAPIRWALAALSRERLVTPRARQGYIVAPLTMKSVKDLLELRIILESAAARLAAGRVDPVRLKSFDDKIAAFGIDHRMGQAEWIMANEKFHLEIARASGNDSLFRAIFEAMEQTRRIIHVSLSVPAQVRTMSDDHKNIIEALEKGDGERARHLTEIHLQESLRAVLAAMVNSSAVQNANFDGRPAHAREGY